MRLEWKELALDDRLTAFKYIAADGVQSAVKIDDAIEQRAEDLIDFLSLDGSVDVEELAN